MLRFFEKLSPPGIGYAVSILAVGAAFLLRSALDPVLGDDYPYALFFGAVALTGLSGRTGPAFLAALSGFLLADFFFISPRHQFIFNGFELPHLLGALAYWFTAGGMILISQVTHAYAEKAQILAETLDRSQAEFRAQYELAPMGAFQTTPEGKFLIANPKFRELTGFSEEELRSRTYFQITHPDDISDNHRMHEQLLGREIPVFALEKRYVRKDGRTIWVKCSANLRRDNHGQPQRLIGFIEDITERKEAEAVRERFFAVGADLLAIAREDGFFQWVSPAWTRALGWSGEEMTSKPWMDFIHPQDRDKTNAFVELLAGEQEMVHFENRYRTKDGKYRWLSWKNKPVGADRLWYCGATDVTSRKEAETALQEALETQRLIVESARDFAIALLDPDGVVQQWNPGAEKVFGYSAGEMVGQKMDVIFTPEDRAADMPSRELETALKEDCAMDERWHQRKDGQRVYISGAVRPLYTGEKVLKGFVKIGRNITERKRMEEELKESRENLERLVTNRTASLQETIQQLEQFSYSLFHDLRAPLRSMCSFAQLLQTGYGERLDSEGNDYLTRIARSAERMDHLINDVLAYRNLGLEPA
ncbi:MAG: domain S-box, partial [Verrucomicrobiales bacterium]|nr:domain S-box [Verrucomicrobiales bacterium]